MTTSNAGWPIYDVPDPAQETERLIRQGERLARATRRFLEDAGIGPGMRVLEIGSGAGDVAFLVADLVGPTGSVVGVDSNADLLAATRARATATSRANVVFVDGDLHAAEVGNDFDAAVGRLVLMFTPDPAAAVRAVAGRVRPGGIVAFQEMDYSIRPTTAPLSPSYEEMRRWTDALRARAGVEQAMGLKLYRTFVDAGLPGPRLSLTAELSAGPDGDYVTATGVLRRALPRLVEYGIVTAAEVDIDTFERRLRDEVVANRGVIMMPPLVGAWTCRL
jgi:ubiquinone/menaquinone biosynthesis C-methylase UbiE